MQSLTTNDVSKMTDGRAQYSILCNERGTVVDDIIVYRFTPTRYILVVNASNVRQGLRLGHGAQRASTRRSRTSATGMR